MGRQHGSSFSYGDVEPVRQSGRPSHQQQFGSMAQCTESRTWPSASKYYKFIIILQGKQQRIEQRVRMLEAGDVPVAPRCVYRQIRERILRLKVRLERREITAYQYAGSVAGSLKLGVVNN